MVLVNIAGIQDFVSRGTTQLTTSFEPYYQFAQFTFLQYISAVKGGCASSLYFSLPALMASENVLSPGHVQGNNFCNNSGTFEPLL